MAINFPNSPSNGDVFGNYTYDTSIPGWRKTPENSASLPAGTIVQWPGATAPANWLICDGSAVSRTTYSSLFAALGVQYGSGDGTTTFNLPNLKGRVAVGLDSSQTEFDTIGETGGSKTHTLTESEMPSHTHIQNSHNHTQDAHNHTQNSHNHTFSGTTSNAGSHNHAIYVDSTQLRYINTSASQSSGMGGLAGISGGADNLRTGTNGDHNHTYSGTTSSPTATNNPTTATNQPTTATNQNTGGGQAHNNLQPYIVLNYIIKTSAGVTSGDSELATRVGVVEAANNATPLSQNYLINGGFDIWQRGTSVTNCGEGVYFADRWAPNEYQTNRVSRVSVTSGLGPVSQYAIRSASRGAASRQVVYQKVESLNSIPLRGKTVTLSFWLRTSSATWSSSATDYVGLRYYIGYNTSTTDAAIGQAGGGFDSSTSALISNGSLPTSWTKYTVTSVVPTTANNVCVRIGMNSDGTATTDTNWFEVTDIQLEEGSYVTPFRRNAPSIQAELAACQRYYYRTNATGLYSVLAHGWQATTTGVTALRTLPVPLRAVPTITSSNVEWSDDVNFNVGMTGLAVTASTDTALIRMNATISANGSSLRPGIIRSSVTGGWLAFESEL